MIDGKNLFESANILLEVLYRLKPKDYKPVYKPFAQARKRIEILFSQLTDQLMIMRNYFQNQCFKYWINT